MPARNHRQDEEVVGDAGEYFDPYNTDSIRFAIERILQSAEYRAELVARGNLRTGRFSWNKCAQETVAVYESLRS